ncbi:bifunctional tRNA (5-methylaminomethyl-2-thiouridine)(34)-methyltransferase MnmD/FAD-dependent 5-carboxymethylaminomethyl-2-thiouridine(34) oxidoreductase MnmC [Marinospirillum sp.]|uniref:bifunctional tRNA (5-methylaminomethyl-2-thiouridine)(34)-methyltransferase MnmD/FAD-dependent 5-carboxymethylaminomethyl-2-thiouridine(34) oxidoreductase MnmC n=1 Tax=Marinospirillum sp. TaxID=2183934 RepID=UPI00286FBEE1|nr:bifunctional tRNA (5-methylaminomethyl-2-thiouridine)(34)-methyltransferase MnmD/FAD-dependent 5-carboxymethylaminomethyl-2-thiouridine(34) oxidoreductase MnmC [Marinospirillum sp.]MDR9467003.1 bifunctional tRNA (5-methylaminomethyl-2-thiouridine)(34)-methyltransferase MnmD/FAD-dependent 5-carboxymethylaminomethyl-2-thiouridine(34) oxidoreductase MnmC [Marinospirillum sp.]
MSELPGYHQPRILENARIDWQAATPVAPVFDDVYFSRDQGPAETRYVFLEQNHLPRRWRDWQEDRAFVVGETGLGTGLNLLLAMQVFLQTAPPDARLHWISTELYPLTAEDLCRAHQHWPELAEYAQALQNNYPLPLSGYHRLQLHPRVTVDLLLGDAASNLGGLQGRVDAWCLDGFAPGKNPGMWTDSLFQALARASHAQTTLATFTCAGVVKRGLQAAGFALEKIPGFGRKREMLRGHFAGTLEPQNSALWYQSQSSAQPGRIALVGAGLAGLATAEALARRGYKVDLYEAQQPGCGGSGNHQGVLYIKLAIATNPASRFYLAGLEYSRRWLQRLDPEQRFWQPSGVLQLALTPKEKDRQARFLDRQSLPLALVRPVSRTEASELAGTPAADQGLFYPRAGWVKPGDLCHHLAQQLPGIRVFHSTPVKDLIHDSEQECWQLHTAQGRQTYDTVILASAFATRQFAPAAWLPVKSIRGQVSHLPLPEKHPKLPKCVVCAGGYVSPAQKGMLCFGASFNLHSDETGLSEEDHQSNGQEMTRSLPDLLRQLGVDNLNEAHLEGRVGFRCTSPDYLPLIGPAPDVCSWEEDYAPLKKNAHWQASVPARNHPGLWLNLGHGSRGLASIPLTAELLASQICGEPAPLESELVEALHPGRFIIRNLKRRNS